MPIPFITFSPLTAGSASNFTCNYTLSPFPVEASATWTLNEVPISSHGRISTDGITLIFSKLTTVDSGSYKCTLNITSLTPHVIVNGDVTMTEVDISIPSKSLFYCVVLAFHYCVHYYYFAVPPPDVAVSLNRTGPLYAGTDLTISCTVTLDQSINNNETVSIHWSVEMGDRYTLINDLMKVSENSYSSSLTISPLTDQESETAYICTGTITSSNSNILSVSNSADVTLSVGGKCSLFLFMF